MARPLSFAHVVAVLAAASFVGCVTGIVEEDDPNTPGQNGNGGTFTGKGGQGPGKGGASSSGGSGTTPGSGGSSSSTGGTGSGGTTSSNGCSAHPAWESGKDYKTGDKVTLEGKLYEAAHENPGYDPKVSTWFWKDLGSCDSVSGSGGSSTGSGGTGGTGPTTGCALDKIMGKEKWEGMYSARRDKDFYTYDSLCKALEHPSLNGFANSGNADNDKRDAAAFFANVSRETGELQYIRQLVQDGNYYGRGPLQITHDYNYRSCGEALGLGDKLVQNPDLLATDKVLTWQCALWFWMVYNFNGNCHQKITSEQDFGATIRIINGGFECPSAGNDAAAQRKAYYTEYCTTLSVSPGSKLDC